MTPPGWTSVGFVSANTFCTRAERGPTLHSRVFGSYGYRSGMHAVGARKPLSDRKLSRWCH
jgi:hypothetical protein